jgi:hypothetical protein
MMEIPEMAQLKHNARVPDWVPFFLAIASK